ncbi:type II toxin-antitoxin system RelE/ParE family toxin [Rhizobium sp. TH2]|uniref:type II toxin-antitoxin system RelE family toxin n=1 Tax=Rhizobium sp. TH2 TaxID=2775403 RepID=UPI002157186F|nr:type II toxin-antitoxin system RelE/ParE family toxin [Rhizobium sp. TH2]UVC09047.1 type II toxin-antitoxin system RelE/ParE family toxin [Rhizobium sp. TH2]
MKIEWHPEAVNELRKLGTPDQRRIKKVLDGLAALDDPRQKLVPYSSNMKGFWKLRVGDIRLVCQLFETDGGLVLVISVAHRSVAYDQRHLKRIEDRGD